MPLFKKQQEEYVELDTEGPESGSEKLLLRVEKMESFADSDRIQQKIRDGYILLVKVRDLREKDVNELKRAVAKIKKTCLALNGEVAGLGEDWLLVATQNAKIHREPAE